MVSTKAEKTITVEVERMYRHPKYKKIVKKVNKFLAHDEVEKAKMGDIVKIEACRPLSKRKTFTLVDILNRQNMPEEFLEMEAVEVDQDA